MLGKDQGDVQEITYLNRRLKLVEEGIQYSHDPQHIDNIHRELGLIGGRSVGTPGTREGEKNSEGAELDSKEASKIRRLIAILNYVSQDRPDIGFATKECARLMSRPQERAKQLVMRVGRYLLRCPSRPSLYRWQLEPRRLTTYTDANWAGCERTRRSTSGGVVLRGLHIIKAWSRTQANVALSSAESELTALVKASTETLGVKRMSQEMGEELHGAILTDSSAARGAVHRSGSGRLKHITTHSLWVQEKAARGELSYLKVCRSENLADVLTHNWDAATGEKMFAKMGLCNQTAEVSLASCGNRASTMLGSALCPRGDFGDYLI